VAPPSAGLPMPRHPSLVAAMTKDGITPEALKAYYVAKGHKPEDMDPNQLPTDYCEKLVANWSKALPQMKGT